MPALGIRDTEEAACLFDLRWLVGASAEDAALGFFFSSRRRHTRFDCDSSDVCSSDLQDQAGTVGRLDLTSSTFTNSIVTGGVPAYVTFNGSGSTAYVANFTNHNVGIIDVATNAQ